MDSNRDTGFGKQRNSPVLLFPNRKVLNIEGLLQLYNHKYLKTQVQKYEPQEFR